MTETFHCGNNAALVGYLYDECEAHERTAIAAHVTVCAAVCRGACGAQIHARTARRMEPARRGARIPHHPTSGASTVWSSNAKAKSKRARWFARPLPAWAQVAAATVVFAVGVLLGIAQGTNGVGSPP